MTDKLRELVGEINEGKWEGIHPTSNLQRRLKAILNAEPQAPITRPQGKRVVLKANGPGQRPKFSGGEETWIYLI